jgi:hypothetical protein
LYSQVALPHGNPEKGRKRVSVAAGEHGPAPTRHQSLSSAISPIGPDRLFPLKMESCIESPCIIIRFTQDDAGMGRGDFSIVGKWCAEIEVHPAIRYSIAVTAAGDYSGEFILVLLP